MPTSHFATNATTRRRYTVSRWPGWKKAGGHRAVGGNRREMIRRRARSRERVIGWKATKSACDLPALAPISPDMLVRRPRRKTRRPRERRLEAENSAVCLRRPRTATRRGGDDAAAVWRLLGGARSYQGGCSSRTGRLRVRGSEADLSVSGECEAHQARTCSQRTWPLRGPGRKGAGRCRCGRRGR